MASYRDVSVYHKRNPSWRDFDEHHYTHSEDSVHLSYDGHQGYLEEDGRDLGYIKYRNASPEPRDLDFRNDRLYETRSREPVLSLDFMRNKETIRNLDSETSPETKDIFNCLEEYIRQEREFRHADLNRERQLVPPRHNDGRSRDHDGDFKSRVYRGVHRSRDYEDEERARERDYRSRDDNEGYLRNDDDIFYRDGSSYRRNERRFRIDERRDYDDNPMDPRRHDEYYKEFTRNGPYYQRDGRIDEDARRGDIMYDQRDRFRRYAERELRRRPDEYDSRRSAHFSERSRRERDTEFSHIDRERHSYSSRLVPNDRTTRSGLTNDDIKPLRGRERGYPGCRREQLSPREEYPRGQRQRGGKRPRSPRIPSKAHSSSKSPVKRSSPLKPLMSPITPKRKMSMYELNAPKRRKCDEGRQTNVSAKTRETPKADLITRDQLLSRDVFSSKSSNREPDYRDGKSSRCSCGERDLRHELSDSRAAVAEAKKHSYGNSSDHQEHPNASISTRKISNESSAIRSVVQKIPPKKSQKVVECRSKNTEEVEIHLTRLRRSGTPDLGGNESRTKKVSILSKEERVPVTTGYTIRTSEVLKRKVSVYSGRAPSPILGAGEKPKVELPADDLRLLIMLRRQRQNEGATSLDKNGVKNKDTLMSTTQTEHHYQVTSERQGKNERMVELSYSEPEATANEDSATATPSSQVSRKVIMRRQVILDYGHGKDQPETLLQSSEKGQVKETVEKKTENKSCARSSSVVVKAACERLGNLPALENRSLNVKDQESSAFEIDNTLGEAFDSRPVNEPQRSENVIDSLNSHEVGYTSNENTANSSGIVEGCEYPQAIEEKLLKHQTFPNDILHEYQDEMKESEVSHQEFEHLAEKNNDVRVNETSSESYKKEQQFSYYEQESFQELDDLSIERSLEEQQETSHYEQENYQEFEDHPQESNNVTESCPEHDEEQQFSHYEQGSSQGFEYLSEMRNDLNESYSEPYDENQQFYDYEQETSQQYEDISQESNDLREPETCSERYEEEKVTHYYDECSFQEMGHFPKEINVSEISSAKLREQQYSHYGQGSYQEMEYLPKVSNDVTEIASELYEEENFPHYEQGYSQEMDDLPRESNDVTEITSELYKEENFPHYEQGYSQETDDLPRESNVTEMASKPYEEENYSHHEEEFSQDIEHFPKDSNGEMEYCTETYEKQQISHYNQESSQGPGHLPGTSNDNERGSLSEPSEQVTESSDFEDEYDSSLDEENSESASKSSQELGNLSDDDAEDISSEHHVQENESTSCGRVIHLPANDGDRYCSSSNLDVVHYTGKQDTGDGAPHHVGQQDGYNGDATFKFSDHGPSFNSEYYPSTKVQQSVGHYTKDIEDNEYYDDFDEDEPEMSNGYDVILALDKYRNDDDDIQSSQKSEPDRCESLRFDRSAIEGEFREKENIAPEFHGVSYTHDVQCDSRDNNHEAIGTPHMIPNDDEYQMPQNHQQESKVSFEYDLQDLHRNAKQPSEALVLINEDLHCSDECELREDYDMVSTPNNRYENIFQNREQSELNKSSGSEYDTALPTRAYESVITQSKYDDEDLQGSRRSDFLNKSSVSEYDSALRTKDYRLVVAQNNCDHDDDIRKSNGRDFLNKSSSSEYDPTLPTKDYGMTTARNKCGDYDIQESNHVELNKSSGSEYDPALPTKDRHIKFAQIQGDDDEIQNLNRSDLLNKSSGSEYDPALPTKDYGIVIAQNKCDEDDIQNSTRSDLLNKSSGSEYDPTFPTRDYDTSHKPKNIHDCNTSSSESQAHDESLASYVINEVEDVSDNFEIQMTQDSDCDGGAEFHPVVETEKSDDDRHVVSKEYECGQIAACVGQNFVQQDKFGTENVSDDQEGYLENRRGENEDQDDVQNEKENYVDQPVFKDDKYEQTDQLVDETTEHFQVCYEDLDSRNSDEVVNEHFRESVQTGKQPEIPGHSFTGTTEIGRQKEFGNAIDGNNEKMDISKQNILGYDKCINEVFMVTEQHLEECRKGNGILNENDECDRQPSGQQPNLMEGNFSTLDELARPKVNHCDETVPKVDHHDTTILEQQEVSMTDANGADAEYGDIYPVNQSEMEDSSYLPENAELSPNSHHDQNIERNRDSHSFEPSENGEGVCEIVEYTETNRAEETKFYSDGGGQSEIDELKNENEARDTQEYVLVMCNEDVASCNVEQSFDMGLQEEFQILHTATEIFLSLDISTNNINIYECVDFQANVVRPKSIDEDSRGDLNYNTMQLNGNNSNAVAQISAENPRETRTVPLQTSPAVVVCVSGSDEAQFPLQTDHSFSHLNTLQSRTQTLANQENMDTDQLARQNASELGSKENSSAENLERTVPESGSATQMCVGTSEEPSENIQQDCDTTPVDQSLYERLASRNRFLGGISTHEKPCKDSGSLVEDTQRELSGVEIKSESSDDQDLSYMDEVQYFEGEQPVGKWKKFGTTENSNLNTPVEETLVTASQDDVPRNERSANVEVLDPENAGTSESDSNFRKNVKMIFGSTDEKNSSSGTEKSIRTAAGHTQRCEESIQTTADISDDAISEEQSEQPLRQQTFENISSSSDSDFKHFKAKSHRQRESDMISKLRKEFRRCSQSDVTDDSEPGGNLQSPCEVVSSSSEASYRILFNSCESGVKSEPYDPECASLNQVSLSDMSLETPSVSSAICPPDRLSLSDMSLETPSIGSGIYDPENQNLLSDVSLENPSASPLVPLCYPERRVSPQSEASSTLPNTQADLHLKSPKPYDPANCLMDVGTFSELSGMSVDTPSSSTIEYSAVTEADTTLVDMAENNSEPYTPEAYSPVLSLSGDESDPELFNCRYMDKDSSAPYNPECYCPGDFSISSASGNEADNEVSTGISSPELSSSKEVTLSSSSKPKPSAKKIHLKSFIGYSSLERESSNDDTPNWRGNPKKSEAYSPESFVPSAARKSFTRKSVPTRSKSAETDRRKLTDGKKKDKERSVENDKGNAMKKPLPSLSKRSERAKGKECNVRQNETTGSKSKPIKRLVTLSFGTKEAKARKKIDNNSGETKKKFKRREHSSTSVSETAIPEDNRSILATESVRKRNARSSTPPLKKQKLSSQSQIEVTSSTEPDSLLNLQNETMSAARKKSREGNFKRPANPAAADKPSSRRESVAKNVRKHSAAKRKLKEGATSGSSFTVLNELKSIMKDIHHNSPEHAADKNTSKASQVIDEHHLLDEGHELLELALEESFKRTKLDKPPCLSSIDKNKESSTEGSYKSKSFNFAEKVDNNKRKVSEVETTWSTSVAEKLNLTKNFKLSGFQETHVQLTSMNLDNDDNNGIMETLKCTDKECLDTLKAYQISPVRCTEDGDKSEESDAKCSDGERVGIITQRTVSKKSDNLEIEKAYIGLKNNEKEKENSDDENRKIGASDSHVALSEAQEESGTSVASLSIEKNSKMHLEEKHYSIVTEPRSTENEAVIDEPKKVNSVGSEITESGNVKDSETEEGNAFLASAKLRNSESEEVESLESDFKEMCRPAVTLNVKVLESAITKDNEREKNNYKSRQETSAEDAFKSDLEMDNTTSNLSVILSPTAKADSIETSNRVECGEDIQKSGRPVLNDKPLEGIIEGFGVIREFQLMNGKNNYSPKEQRQTIKVADGVERNSEVVQNVKDLEGPYKEKKGYENNEFVDQDKSDWSKDEQLNKESPDAEEKDFDQNKKECLREKEPNKERKLHLDDNDQSRVHLLVRESSVEKWNLKNEELDCNMNDLLTSELQRIEKPNMENKDFSNDNHELPVTTAEDGNAQGNKIKDLHNSNKKEDTPVLTKEKCNSEDQFAKPNKDNSERISCTTNTATTPRSLSSPLASSVMGAQVETSDFETKDKRNGQTSAFDDGISHDIDTAATNESGKGSIGGAKSPCKEEFQATSSATACILVAQTVVAVDSNEVATISKGSPTRNREEKDSTSCKTGVKSIEPSDNAIIARKHAIEQGTSTGRDPKSQIRLEEYIDLRLPDISASNGPPAKTSSSVPPSLSFGNSVATSRASGSSSLPPLELPFTGVSSSSDSLAKTKQLSSSLLRKDEKESCIQRKDSASPAATSSKETSSAIAEQKCEVVRFSKNEEKNTKESPEVAIVMGLRAKYEKKMIAILQKRVDVEKAYREECASIVSAVKALARKKKNMKIELQDILQSSLHEISQKYITELQRFVRNETI